MMIPTIAIISVSGFCFHQNHVPSRYGNRQSETSFWATFSNEESLSSSMLDDWGVTKEHWDMEFPHSIEQVIQQAFDAVAGTIYNKCALDPNIASNARSTSIFTYRPVRKKCDSGRIGLEMDGVDVLFQDELTPHQAIRRTALMLAAKLSLNQSWKSYEVNDSDDKESDISETGSRPVVVHFNSVKQALWASKELRELKRLEQGSLYDNIRIQCLSDGVPLDMQLDKNERRRYGGLSKGFVNATRGLFIIVQPTDYNAEHEPPGPAIDSIDNFQRVIAQAAIEEIPIVALSPRFLSNDDPFYIGYDQSGYQKSAIFGGGPPKGPTPWIMRDFTPPVFCWIGNALTVGKPPKEDCRITRVSLTQSVMEEGHSWNIFFAKECANQGLKDGIIEYTYLASSRSAAGRPTSELMMTLLEDHVGTTNPEFES